MRDASRQMISGNVQEQSKGLRLEMLATVCLRPRSIHPMSTDKAPADDFSCLCLLSPPRADTT
jgi:hypothetical protein